MSQTYTIMAMANSAFSLIFYKLLLCILLAFNHHLAEATVTCSQVCSDLHPCVSYLISGGSVPTTCCNGLKSLNASATTTIDRQVVCKCIQSATIGVSFTSYCLRLAVALPAKCGLRIPYQITPTTDCNRIP